MRFFAVAVIAAVALLATGAEAKHKTKLHLTFRSVPKIADPIKTGTDILSEVNAAIKPIVIDAASLAKLGEQIVKNEVPTDNANTTKAAEALQAVVKKHWPDLKPSDAIANVLSEVPTV